MSVPGPPESSRRDVTAQMSPLRGAAHRFVRPLSLCHVNIQVSIRMRPSRDGDRSPVTSTALSSLSQDCQVQRTPGPTPQFALWGVREPSLILQIQGHQRGHRREVVELWGKLEAARASP